MTQNKVVKNATWIIGFKIAQSVLSLLISMLTARYLGPANYGLINYAASLVAFVTPVMNLGLTGVLVLEIVNKPEREGETLGTAICMSLASGFLCMLGVISFTAITSPSERETVIVCSMYSIVLLVQAVELIQYWFQAKLLSKYTSIAMFSAKIVAAAYKIFLLATGKSVYWFTIASVLDFLVVDVVLFWVYKKFSQQRLTVSFSRIKQLLSRSRYYIVSDLMVVIFAQTDRIMLKMMLGDSATGYYSAAITVASLTSFIAVAIIDSARPAILEGKREDQSLFEHRVVQLYSVIIYFALAQSVVIALGAPLIIEILYGSEFLDAVSALRIVVWYTTFSYLGSVRNIWILAEGRQAVLWKINLSGATANVLLNYFLIPVWGVNGAAIASLTTQFFTNVITGMIFTPIKDNNRLMLKAADVRVSISLLKKLMKRKKDS